MDPNQDTVRSTRELLFDSDPGPDWGTGTQDVELTPEVPLTAPAPSVQTTSVTETSTPVAGASAMETPPSIQVVPETPQSPRPSPPGESGDNTSTTTQSLATPRMSHLSVHWEPELDRERGSGDDLEVTKGRVTFSRKRDIVFITAQTSVEEDPGPISPRSIASHTSGSSNDKPTKKDLELEMKLCIALLFVFMVTGVSLVFHFYNIQQLEIMTGRRLVYQKTQRDVVLYNHKQQVVLEGILGLNLHPDKLPVYCDGKHHADKTNKFCLTWKNLATLSISSREVQDDVSCYDISWQSLSPELLLQDCFRLGNDSWYGLGLAYEQRWPLTRMSVKRTPFVVGSGQTPETLGPVLEPYILSSAGVSLKIRSAEQLEISFNAPIVGANSSDNGDNLLCLYSGPDHHRTVAPHINYTVCVARDVRQAHNVSFVPPPSADPPPDPTLLYPVWSTLPALATNYSQAAVQDYVRQIVTARYRRSILVIDGPWESSLGDHDFDQARFPDPHTLIEDTQSHGFDVVLAAHPYLSYDSDSFVVGVRDEFLVRDVTGNVPGFTRWQLPAPYNLGSNVGAVVDVTGPGMNWLQAEIRNLTSLYNIDGVYWVGGQIDTQPYNPTLAGNISSFNDYITQLAGLQTSPRDSLTVQQSGYNSQAAPGLLRVSGRTSTWRGNGLSSVIPTTLTLGLLGYHHILTDVIGGNSYDHFPSRELYIRWMQVSTFLPTMHFSVPPDRYDELTRILAVSLLQTRGRVVVPALRAAQVEGVAAVRPLWMEWPEDPEALTLDDEFLVGHGLLVAPVLTEGVRLRDVYLPRGAWYQSGSDTVLSGPRWLRDQSVPLSHVLYFVLAE